MEQITQTQTTQNQTIQTQTTQEQITQEQTEIKDTAENKTQQKKEIWAIGRRKTSVARIRLLEGTGKITINGKDLNGYFGGHNDHKIKIEEPLKIFENMPQYNIIVDVKGGGLTGQAEAIRLGIARAISKLEPSLRPKLKAKGFLRRDPRMVERKKSGQPKARKKFQWTKR